IARRLSQAFDDVGRSRQVWIADAEAYDVYAARLQCILFLVDLGEQIWWKRLNSLGFFDYQYNAPQAGGLATQYTVSLSVTNDDSNPAPIVDCVPFFRPPPACRGVEWTRISARRKFPCGGIV